MGRNWAITIGINKYDYLQSLDYAQRDSEAMRDFFQQELNVQPVYHFAENAAPIRSDFGADLNATPNLDNLRRFLRVRFEQPFLKPGDNLWFFFAGHGKRHEDRDYLLPMGADPGDVEHSGISLQYITERLRRSGADNVVLLVDACRSGGGRRDGVGFGQEKQPGVITLFACSPWESSYEIAELQQGAFTYALLQGLRLEGEGNNCATVERLYARLRQTVPQLTQQYKRAQQTPYGVVEPPTKYHLILLPRKANLSDIVTLKNDALRAEVQRDFKLAKQFWIRVLAVSSADSDAIEGIERLALVSAVPVASPAVSPPDPQPTGQRDATPTGEAQIREVDLGNQIKLEMLWIPGGRFQMGSPQEELDRRDTESPQHSVTVPDFWMSKFPVTQAQWKAVAALPKVKQDLEVDPSRFKGEKRPVEQVSWHDAVEFCARLSHKTQLEYRLPSEAEWEYACRAGTTTPFYFGETITKDLANYNGEQTTEVGSFPPNAFGLYDMHGNTWEWCLDHWHESYKGAPTDGSAWINWIKKSEPRVLRGGSWLSLPRDCRSAPRGYNDAGVRLTYHVGFRVVCSASRTL